MLTEDGLNFNGIKRMLALIPCRKLRQCEEKIAKRCKPLKNKAVPCWASEEKCADPLPSCRDCPVYKSITHCDDLMDLIYDS